MITAYVGIDPGITGAVAVIPERLESPMITDVPTYTNRKGKTEYDFYKMYKMLGKLSQEYEVHLCLEKQQAMTMQGVSSTFSIGRGYGAWEALCWATTPNFQIVSPRKWKRFLGLTSDKDTSRELAITYFPGMMPLLKRKKDHNRAEALLLAYYSKISRGVNI